MERQATALHGWASVTRNRVWWPSFVVALLAIGLPPFSFVALPVVYLLLFARGAVSPRIQRALLGAQTARPLVLIGAGLACGVSAYEVLSLAPDGASDNAWLALLVPLAWLGLGGVTLITAGFAGWSSRRRPVLGGVALANALTGAITVAALLAITFTANERDLNGNAFRGPMTTATAVTAALWVLTVLACRFGSLPRPRPPR